MSFFHLGFGHISFLYNNEPVIKNVPTILYILLLHGTLGTRNLLQHFGHFFLVYEFYKSIDKIEKNEMGWACGAYG